MAADRPKQFMRLAGRTVIEHALRPFLEHPGLLGAVVVLNPSDAYWGTLPAAQDSRIWTVTGGAERCQSVFNGLVSLRERARDEDWVLVHDAARPCLSRSDLDRLLMTAGTCPAGGLLATPVRDTLKRADGAEHVRDTVDRSDVWHALTPQMFRFTLLYEALARALSGKQAITDEASAVEALGLAPRLVTGRADNIKITVPEDLTLAEYFLTRTEAVTETHGLPNWTGL